MGMTEKEIANYCRKAAALLKERKVSFDGDYTTWKKVKKTRKTGLFRTEEYEEPVLSSGKNYWELERSEETDSVPAGVRTEYDLLTLSIDGELYSYYVKSIEDHQNNKYHPYWDVKLKKMEYTESAKQSVETYLKRHGLEIKTQQTKAPQPVVKPSKPSSTQKPVKSIPARGNNTTAKTVERQTQTKTAQNQSAARSEHKQSSSVNVPDISKATKATTTSPVQEDTGIQILKQYAESGDVRAQYDLAVRYRIGKGTPIDKRQAFRWYQTAADNGHTDAMCALAGAYRTGDLGLQKDMNRAYELYTKAEQKGNRKAVTGLGKLGVDLGDMYYKGIGVPQDYSAAMDWYFFGAKKGNAAAMCSLGIMYEFGEGTEKNLKFAFEWYQTAADNGDKPAQARLKRLPRP